MLQSVRSDGTLGLPVADVQRLRPHLVTLVDLAETQLIYRLPTHRRCSGGCPCSSDVDPFIGTEATDCPPQHGLAATWWWPKPQVGNTHPGATLPARHGVCVRVLRRLPDRLRAVRHEHRGRPARALRPAVASRLHPLPAVRHRRDPQVLQLLPGHPDAASRWTTLARLGPARRGGRAGLLRRRRSSSGIRCELTVGPKQRGAPLHVPGAPRTPGWSSTSRWAGWPSRTVDRAAAGPPAIARPRGRSGRDRGRGRAAGHARRVRRPATGGSCSGTTAD